MNNRYKSILDLLDGKQQEKPVLLIDGMNLFIRNFVVNPALNSNGSHVGGVVGTLQSLTSLVKFHNPKQVIFVWDGKGGSARRKKIYSEYKSGRTSKFIRNKTIDEDLQNEEENMKLQILRVVEYLRNLPVLQIAIDSIEADDVIAYAANYLPDDRKIIVSSDKDYLQLVSDTVSVWSPIKKKMYSPEAVIEEFGVLPPNVAIMKAVTSDKSDNIKGVSGIGPKTLVKLFGELKDVSYNIDTFKTLLTEKMKAEKVNPNLVKIHDSWAVVEQNYTLVQLLEAELISASILSKIRSLLQVKNTSINKLKLDTMMWEDGLMSHWKGQPIYSTFLGLTHDK